MDVQPEWQQLLERSAQDRLIAARLPDWMKAVSHEHMADLSHALIESLKYRQQLQVLWGAIQGLEAFAAPLLAQALKRHGLNLGIDQLWFRNAYDIPLKTYAPIRVPLTEKAYFDVPLLEAALGNFTERESTLNGLAKGCGLFDDKGERLQAPSAQQFAKCVRELDLGAQYQQYLQSHLGTATAQALLSEHRRHEMLIDAFKACHAGVLRPRELTLVLDLWRSGNLSRLDGAPVIAKRLELLGCPLQQIVVLDVRDETFAPVYTSTRRVLVHIPGDPHGPWSAYDDLQLFARKVLGQRLRDSQYQQFFSRFVRRRDSQAFFTQVIEGYRDLAVWANIDLDERSHALPTPLFKALAKARVAQVCDDAATLAMPVSQLDRAVQQAHDQRLAAEGWTLIGLAGIFVPAIGVTLLAVTAWGMLKDVFQAVDAWHDGETSEAMDHITHVATDLAIMAAIAAGMGVAQKLWARSRFVDSLVQVSLDDGTQRLWNCDLQAFRSAPPPPAAILDEQGISRLGGRTWINMDGHTYPVVQRETDGQWQLVPREGHGPLLQHNGAGAWRLWSEQPAQWGESAYMFRRLGGPMAELDDERVAQVLAIHDIDADQLRALHVLARAPEPAMVDTALRASLEQRISRVVRLLRAGEAPEDHLVLPHVRQLEAASGLADPALAEWMHTHRRLLLQQLYEGLAQVDTPPVNALRRIFPGLPGRAAQALLDAASSEDLERLQQTGRVPLRLAEAARVMLLQVRMVRAYEALYMDAPQGTDVARLTLGMLRHLPGASSGIRWRLFAEQTGDMPLATTAEGAHTWDLLHVDQGFALLDTHGTRQAVSGDLFEVMAAAYTDEQRIALQVGEPFAHNLRVWVTRLAQTRREEVAALLGGARTPWFRLPSRLADGRVGYPVSGRGQGRGIPEPQPGPYFRRIRYLYPTFTNAQVFAWIDHARRSVLGLEGLLRTREQEFELLNSQLHAWARAGASHPERVNRRSFRRALRGCWQHVLNEGQHRDDLNAVYRWEMVGTRIESFPEIPDQVRFYHVSVLSLRNMRLTTVPESFLRAFPNVASLEMPGNQLSRVPQALMQMTRLRMVDLSDNHIRLDPAQSTILGSCPNLVSINLAYNPLGRTFSVNGLPRLNELYLAGTGISELPHGLLESPSVRLLDLHDNRFTQLPEGFFQSRLWVEGDVQLRGNPLSEAEQARYRDALFAVAEIPGRPLASPARLRWMDAIGLENRTALSACWTELQVAPGADHFFHLLERLMETADFQSLTGSRYLACRVLTLLRAMRNSTALRDELFGNAEQLTCQDSVALRFSNLELRLLLWQAQADAASGNEEQRLLRLGRQLWRLDEVDLIAREDIEQRRNGGADPDEIEVVLAYRLALRIDLDLPIQTNSMTFRQVADVDARRIGRARARVLDNEGGRSLAASLIERDFWRTHLHSAYVSRFESFNAPFHERLEQLSNDPALPEVDRVPSMDRVAAEQQVAEREFMLELTLDALDASADTEGVNVR